MIVSAKPGSFKAKAFDAIAWVIERIQPGSITTELQCLQCGAAVEPSNAAGHLAYFHPEAQ